MKNILGVTFKNNPNMVEHQWFPVEYFTGSDITIFIGDVFLSEVTALSFTLTEKVLPIFSYASKTYDHASRGSRLVEGIIQIPFLEAGYLETIFSRMAKLMNEKKTVKPRLAFVKSGEKPPGWVADFKMDIEGALTKDNKNKNIDVNPQTRGNIQGITAELPNKKLSNYVPQQNGYTFIGGAGMGGFDYSKKTVLNDKVEAYEREVWGRADSKDVDRKYQTFFYEDRTREQGNNTQEILKEKGFDIYITYGPQPEAEKYNAWKSSETPALDIYSFNTTVKAIRGIQLTSSGQTITAENGTVFEQYSFIAKDLD